MPRLAIALTAALGFHVLLLMTTLPQQQLAAPEVKGSDHVTISFVRPTPPAKVVAEEPIEVVAEEPVEEPEQPRQSEEMQQQELEIEQVALPVTEPSLRQFEPVVENAKEKNVASEEIPVASLPGKNLQQEEDLQPEGAEAMLSEVETLRSPEPVKEFNRPPVYPSLARKRGWEGTVLLEVEVLSDGMVESIKVKVSSSYKLLDTKALDAVSKWRFSPGYKAGEPVRMKVLVPIHFLLQDT